MNPENHSSDPDSDDLAPADRSSLNEDPPLAAIGVLPVAGALGAAPTGLGSPGQQGAVLGGIGMAAVVDTVDRMDTADEQVARRIETALAEEPTLSPATLSGLRLAVDGGVVTLLGTAASAHDRDAAERVALQQAGVRSVDNRLTLG